jgi:hypothetical protein
MLRQARLLPQRTSGIDDDPRELLTSDNFLQDNSSDEDFTEPLLEEIKHREDKPPDKLPV